MKKFTKILVTAVCFTAIGTMSVFANGRDNKGPKDNDNMRRPPVEMNDHMPLPPDAGKLPGMGFMEPDIRVQLPPAPALIGQISSVDEKNGTVTIADLDGKEKTVMVNPFTHIIIEDSREPKKISDLKKGDWVMYALFNTETENKLACRIFVKN